MPRTELNPFAPEHRDNPYPVYAELRDLGPLVYLEKLGFWVATTAASVQEVLTNADRFSSTKGIGRARNEVIQRPTMLTRDPPEHTRLRALVSRAFTPRRIAELEPRITQIVNERLDVGLEQGEFDVVKSLARPLPTLVLADLLGVEYELIPNLVRWSDDIFRSVAGLGKPEERERARQSYVEFDAYFGAQIEERRRRPQEDLLGMLVMAHDDHAALSTVEILSFCMLLFIAGTETTTNLLANALLALMENPDVADSLRKSPESVGEIIEETLRYDAPVQGIFRTTRADFEAFGEHLDVDQKVCALIASANRDPAGRSDPDRFDPKRSPSNHIAFGYGAHYCLGASLARLEARLALTQIFQKTRAIFPMDVPKRLDMPMVRGLASYQLRLEPA